VIRVLVVDDHPAVRAGLESVLGIEPGIDPVASCGSVSEALALVPQVRPTVVLVDYDLRGDDGLELCMRLYPAGVRTLVFSAYGEQTLAAAALLAGASGLIGKVAAGDELCDAIRCVARGVRLFPPVIGEVLEVLVGRLDADDLPILGMALEGNSRAEIAESLGLPPRALDRRMREMVARVRPRTAGRRLTRGLSVL
jgi:DNA-binding NarL/FixJ family response regulator